MVGQGAEAEMVLPFLCTSLPGIVNFQSYLRGWTWGVLVSQEVI
jgi:hypothetical protein